MPHRASVSVGCRLVALAALAGALGLASDSHADQMPWRTDLAAARAEAKQANKLVLIHFWTESCGPCRMLEHRVFAAPGVGAAVAENYVPVKVNARVEGKIAEMYGVKRVPTDVVITPEGALVKAFVSPATPVAYLGLVSELAAQRQSQQSAFDKVAAAAPFARSPQQQQLPAAQPPLNPAYSQLTLTPPSSPSSPMAPSTAVGGVSDTAGRYGPAAPATVTPPAAPVATPATPPVAAKSASPAPAPQVATTAVPTINRYAAQESPAPAKASEPANTTVTIPPPARPLTADAPAKAGSDLASKLPAGSPLLGFEGYCAVTMKREWRWAQGDPKWGAIHRGRTYLFISEAARDAFLAEPDTFSPALSGADPVLAVESRKVVEGTREYAVEYEGRFFLFANEQTLGKFWTDPKAYAQGAARVAAGGGANDTLVR